MKVINYVGAEGECIVIQRPTDIYPMLDWLHTQMIDRQSIGDVKYSVVDWQKSIDYISKLMNQIEKDGLGSQDDIDSIEYS